MNQLFSTHNLNAAGVATVNSCKQKFNDLLSDLEQLCLASREFSICKTHLETACFYAVKTISSLPEFQAQ